VKASEFLNPAHYMTPRYVSLPIDLCDADTVGFQTSADGQRVWLCINGDCVLRVKGIKRLEFHMDHVMGAKNV